MPSKPLAPSSTDDTQGIWKKVINQELSLDQLENQYITATLDRLGWNKSAAARQLGIERRTTLDRKLKKYGITKPD
ncbi:MAG: helix-turn-helix domain-containing protein [Planctomycetaceae bacterium]